MIDRYLLRYFLAVIDCGGFSKAAKQLNVAQPTLSVGIRKLERLLGAPVFNRNSKRVQITDAGSRLAAHARRIENEFNLAEAAVANLKPVRALRLGVLSTLPIGPVADSLRAAKRSAHQERLQLVPGNEQELLQRLRRGQIDAALTIAREDSERFAPETLFTEHYALAMPSDHLLADQKSIPPEDLADNTMIVRRHCEALSDTSRYFTEHGVRPFFAYRSTNDDQVLALVQAGLGITVMPASYSLKGVVRPLLEGFNLKRRIGFLYADAGGRSQHAASPMLQALRAQYSNTP
jgi:DNA-binding transcriptional LysR family regulator